MQLLLAVKTQWQKKQLYKTHPFIRDDLIGSVLGVVDWQRGVVLAVAWICYFGFESGTRCRTAGVTS